MRAAIFLAVLLAVGHLAAAQDATCPFKEGDLSAVNWKTAKTACAAPQPGFCSACICGLKNAILDGLAKKGIKVAAADQAALIQNCLGALITPLSDPAVGNLADEVGQLGNCADPVAIAGKCPAAGTVLPTPKAKAGASPAPVEVTASPSPAAVPVLPASSPAASSPAASSPAVSSPPPKSAAGTVVASMGAVAAVALLQAMLV